MEKFGTSLYVPCFYSLNCHLYVCNVNWLWKELVSSKGNQGKTNFTCYLAFNSYWKNLFV